MRKIITVLFSTLFILSQSAISATSGAEVLRLDSGVRSASLGESGVARLAGLDGVGVNPSLGSGVKSIQVGMQYSTFYASLDGGLNQGSFSALLPLGKIVQGDKKWGVLSVAFQYLSSVPFAAYDDFGALMKDSVAYSAMSVSAGYGRSILSLPGLEWDAGLSAKYVNIALDGEKLPLDATFDLGTRVAIALASENVSKVLGKTLLLGASVQNLAFQDLGDYSATPITVRLGVGLVPLVGLGLNLDGVYTSTASIEARIGAEYLVKNILLLRVGTRLGSGMTQWFSAGLGARIPVAGKRLSFDYALIPDIHFGLVNRFGVQINI